MNTEIPIYYNLLRQEFRSSLTDAKEGEFIERPKSLRRMTRLRKEFVENSRQTNRLAKQRLDSESAELAAIYGTSKLRAMDILLKAWDTENRLEEEGVIFGNKAFNFSLDRLPISLSEEECVIDYCKNFMAGIDTLSKEDLRKMYANQPINSTESILEDLGLSPNAARLDFLLTPDGPMIIEANLQWVDAINALSGFLTVYGQAVKGKKLIEEFSKQISKFGRLAIIDLPQTTSSRALGATNELAELARKVSGGQKTVETIDPSKIRPSYLSQFDTFYINCDPKLFFTGTPDWLETILELARARGAQKTLFPAWRPLLDKKELMATLSNPSDQVLRILSANGVDVEKLRQSIVPIVQLEDYKGGWDKYVVKGDGYSLNSVAISNTRDFDIFEKNARNDPGQYVVQPFIEGRRIDAWVYDTGSAKPKFLKQAYSKLNVWFINGKVVGMLATLSDEPLISDKGYNAPPIVRKDTT